MLSESCKASAPPRAHPNCVKTGVSCIVYRPEERGTPGRAAWVGWVGRVGQAAATPEKRGGDAFPWWVDAKP